MLRCIDPCTHGVLDENPGGVRIGTSEFYRQLDGIHEVIESVVVGQRSGDDVQVAMFVVMREGYELTDELIQTIWSRIRSGTTPRHMPSLVAAVPDIPKTRNGKITEIAARDATDHVCPAVEIIAARSYRTDPESGRTRTVIDTISDNAADAGIVCGASPVGPREIDLRWVGALGYRNGIIEETGIAAGVLNHPATGIVWLAHRYAQQGLTLDAGQTILAGSFTRPIDIRPGDEFRFDFGPFGSFQLSFD